MAQDPLIEKLAKANGNVRKLSEFLAARRHWTVAADCEPSARNTTAAAVKLDDHLKVLIRAAGAEPKDPFEAVVETRDFGTHDCDRLDRFSAFLRDLDAWLVAQPGPPKDPDVIAALQEMESCVRTIVDVTGAIKGEPQVPQTPALTPADDGATQTAQVGVSAADTTASIPAGAPQQLALDDTDEHPMVQEFRGLTELTAECTDMVDKFLAAWGIEYSYYNRKKLLERILRWITSAPEGHVLVIKMKTVEEPYQPYPSYISREVLAGNPQAKDPWS